MVALSLVAGEVRAIEPPASEPAEAEATKVIDIAVDVADLPESRADIDVVVERELQRLLAEQQQLPAGVVLLDDRRLWIEVRPGPIPGSDDVLLRIEAQLDGKLLAESLTESCLSCSNEQVAQKALSMSRPLLEKFPVVERHTAAVPSPDATTEADNEETDRPRPRDPMLISGATMLGLGIAGLGVGVGLIAADERVLSEPGAARLDVIKYADPGIAVAVIGGAVAITGAALIGVALKRRGRSNVTATPMLAPNLHGIGVVGRF